MQLQLSGIYNIHRLQFAPSLCFALNITYNPHIPLFTDIHPNLARQRVYSAIPRLPPNRKQAMLMDAVDQMPVGVH